MGQRLRLDIGPQTDVGMVRDHNEDSLGVFEDYQESFQLSQDMVNRKGRLYAVADGMGGHAAGEVASRKAINVLFRHYYEDMDIDLRRSLEQAFWAANAEIYAHAASNAAHSGMGTTLVAAVVQDDELLIANVGDSRAYLITNGQIRQLSRDHSWVNEQVEAGLLSEAEAQAHIYRNIITRSMGSRPEVDVDTFSTSLRAGDIVLLCSDGLSNEVPEEEILQIVTSHESAQDAAAQLIQAANRHGGNDNVTALVVRVVEVVPERTALPWLAVAALCAVLLLGLFGLCVSSSPLAGYILPNRQGAPSATAVQLTSSAVSSETQPAQPAVRAATRPKPTSIAPARSTAATVQPLPTFPIFGWEIVAPTAR